MEQWIDNSGQDCVERLPHILQHENMGDFIEQRAADLGTSISYFGTSRTVLILWEKINF